MTIAVSQWAREDLAVQRQINEIQPLLKASGCVGLRSLPLIHTRGSIKNRIDELIPSNDEDGEWLRDRIIDISGFIECEEAIVLFVKLEEADVLLIYKNYIASTSGSQYHINNDNWTIISLEPLLIMSMYGAILGICQAPNAPRIVTICEGDSGWC